MEWSSARSNQDVILSARKSACKAISAREGPYDGHAAQRVSTRPLCISPHKYASSRVNPRQRTLIDGLGMKLKIPDGKFGAYLFDCDGTVVDSMPLHYVAWSKVLSEWQCEFEESFFYSLGGMPVRDIIATLNRKHGLCMPVEEVAHRKEDLYFELLPQLKAVPEVLEHVEEAHGRIPCAVVSGSTRDSVVASLEALQLSDRLETLVCAGDYKKGKPDPEALLMAAHRRSVKPDECLVFEDTDMGIEAATAAGMGSVKVPPPWERGVVSQ